MIKRKLPKSFTDLKRVIKKVDIRKFPPEHEKVKFPEGTSRRFINVGISTRDFFKGCANHINDKELKNYADEIEKAIYSRDGEQFDIWVNMFKARMAELGVWKSVKGLTKMQTMKVLAKLKKDKGKYEKIAGEVKK